MVSGGYGFEVSKGNWEISGIVLFYIPSIFLYGNHTSPINVTSFRKFVCIRNRSSPEPEPYFPEFLLGTIPRNEPQGSLGSG
jgi:hypothetical protein